MEIKIEYPDIVKKSVDLDIISLMDQYFQKINDEELLDFIHEWTFGELTEGDFDAFIEFIYDVIGDKISRDTGDTEITLECLKLINNTVLNELIRRIRNVSVSN